MCETDVRLSTLLHFPAFILPKEQATANLFILHLPKLLNHKKDDLATQILFYLYVVKLK